jgi:hypothetical protein
MNRVGLALSSELDRQRLGQAVIEAATRLTGAAYGRSGRTGRWRGAAQSG